VVTREEADVEDHEVTGETGETEETEKVDTDDVTKEIRKVALLENLTQLSVEVMAVDVVVHQGTRRMSPTLLLLLRLLMMAGEDWS